MHRLAASSASAIITLLSLPPEYATARGLFARRRREMPSTARSVLSVVLSWEMSKASSAGLVVSADSTGSSSTDQLILQFIIRSTHAKAISLSLENCAQIDMEIANNLHCDPF